MDRHVEDVNKLHEAWHEAQQTTTLSYWHHAQFRCHEIIGFEFTHLLAHTELVLLLLSASPVKGRHIGFSSPFGPIHCIILEHVNHCHVTASKNILSAFQVSSFLEVPPSAPFSQYSHHLSSVHVQTTHNYICEVTRHDTPKRILHNENIMLRMSYDIPTRILHDEKITLRMSYDIPTRILHDEKIMLRMSYDIPTRILHNEKIMLRMPYDIPTRILHNEKIMLRMSYDIPTRILHNEKIMLRMSCDIPTMILHN